MQRFFTRERFGTPQFFAGLLLLALLAQCVWLIARERAGAMATSEDEFSRVQHGLSQWHGLGVAGTTTIPANGFDPPSGARYDPQHSPLWYLVSSAPIALFRVSPDARIWIWLTRAPYVLFGVLLGASLWYVARRLYGNVGGYCALGLYCFSPLIIRNSTLWFSPPAIGGAWGTFGAVFTAIAVTHTLYAPREVVLWNWRRIVLLGISLALAVGSDFRLVIILPIILFFMLYLVPERWPAACAILASACAVGCLLLFAAYSFHPGIFWKGLTQARYLDITLPALRMPGAYLQVLEEVAASGPVLVVLTPAAVIAFALWRRARYFGNIAPLLVAVLFLALRVDSPHETGTTFTFIGAVFLFLWIAGIAADALETKARELLMAFLVGLLAANAIWNLIALARISG